MLSVLYGDDGRSRSLCLDLSRCFLYFFSAKTKTQESFSFSESCSNFLSAFTNMLKVKCNLAGTHDYVTKIQHIFHLSPFCPALGSLTVDPTTVNPDNSAALATADAKSASAKKLPSLLLILLATSPPSLAASDAQDAVK